MIQRIVQFEKGSVNILKEIDEKSCEVELSSMSTQSSASFNSKSSNDGVPKESTRTVIPSHSRKRQKITRSQEPKRLSEIELLKELLPSTSAVTLPKISIPESAVLQVLTRNEEALMRSWAKKHCKSGRQRNVRQDNIKDRARTLPLNLYESETILNPLNLQLVTTGVQPDIIESLDNEVREEHTTEQPEPIDTYSESDNDTDSGDRN